MADDDDDDFGGDAGQRGAGGAHLLEITEENFEDVAVASPVPIILDFWAAWCEPCKALGPILSDLALTYAGRVAVGKVDVDSQGALAAAFGVRGIPTMVVLRDGEAVIEERGFRGRARVEALFAELAGA
ncbi:MAG: hypothetical protein RL071_4065 [Pseudomonadota bacterium]|jgi:thioredoxin